MIIADLIFQSCLQLFSELSHQIHVSISISLQLHCNWAWNIKSFSQHDHHLTQHHHHRMICWVLTSSCHFRRCLVCGVCAVWLELIAEINANCRNYSLPVPGPSNNYPPRVLIQIAHRLPRLWDAHHLLLPGKNSSFLAPRLTIILSFHTTAHQHLLCDQNEPSGPLTPLDFVWPKEDGWPWPIVTNWEQLETLGAMPKTQLIEVFSCL